MPTDSDIQLMLSFRDGDRRAFQLLFEKYKKRVITFCYRYCGHRGIAEELAQETFLKVYRAAHRYEPKARFSTWLFKIAANVCLNEIRKSEYRAEIESIDKTIDEDNDHTREFSQEPDISMPDALLEISQDRVMIRKAMALLPAEQRTALLLRATEGFSYEEIGQQIHCSENRVKTLIYRGRQRLKQSLGNLWGNNEH